MATRRLVQRSRQNEESSPISRPRQSASLPGRPRGAQSKTVLPPYEVPSCPLSEEARRELNKLGVEYDTSKLQLSLKASKQALITSTADVFERSKLKREAAEKATSRRRKAGGNDDEPTEHEIDAVREADALESQVQEIRKLAEKAIRDVIDLEDELNMNQTLMKDTITKIPPIPAAVRVQISRNQRNQNQEGEEEEEGESDNREGQLDEEVRYEYPEVSGVDTMALLNEERQKYFDNYTSTSMRQRYESTDYATFIRTVHSSQFGDDIPVPHARTWFNEDINAAQSSKRRRTNGNNEESDDDIVVSRATATLKCLFTLAYFVIPYSNKVCKHTFEKSAFLEYFKKEAKPEQRDGRGRPVGPLSVECPQSGCPKMLHLEDFFEDSLIARQVKRAQQEEAREADDESEEEDKSAPRGSQRNRPEQIGSDDDVEIEDDGNHQQRNALNIKQERGASHRASTAASARVTQPMDLDDDDDHDEEEEDEDDEY